MEVWGGNLGVDRAFEMPGLEVWIFSRPFGAEASGGDVYYLSSCASGRITRMLLADVSGHGAVVSRIALALRDLMRRNVNVVSQKRLLESMNREFAAVAKEGGFATALVSTFFAPTRSLVLCNAGHPPPFVYRASSKSWSVFDPQQPPDSTIHDTPLGVSDEAHYTLLTTRLQRGDMLFAYSDGLIEGQIGADRILGVQGLLRLLRETSAHNPPEIIADILQRVVGASGQLDQDDVTVILMQATGSRTTWKDNLLAPFRLLRQARLNTAVRSARA